MIRRLLLAAALAVHTLASASVVTAQYTPQGGDLWTVSFTVQNDGTLPAVGGFTIYFPEAAFSALSLENAPGTWDTIVVQPDLGLPAAGFLDTFAIDPADALGAGDSIGGFEVSFSFQGARAPGRLVYDIVDENFEVLESGFTVSAGDPPAVPEPATWWLVALAIAGATWRRPAERVMRSQASHA